jgi:hypothetical protein
MAGKHDEDDEEDLLNQSIITGPEVTLDPLEPIDAVLEDLEALLKNGDVTAVLSARGLNASLALVAASGLRAYLKGEKADAAEDFATVAEEIRGRMQASGGGSKNGGKA